MSAILVLLGLLSLATLASRRGYALFIAHIVSIPLLLAVGVLLSPRALGLFTEATIEALLPAMRVGAAWLALLVGMRAGAPRKTKRWGGLMASTLLASGFTWALAAAAAFGVMLASVEFKMGFSESVGSRLSEIGAALLMGGIVTGTGLTFTREALQDRVVERATRTLTFISRHDDVVGAAAVCVAIWLWPLPASHAPIYEVPGVSVAVIIGLGFSLFCAQLLTGERGTGRAGSQSLIGMIGLLVFASGLSTTAVLPGAAIAFFFGGFLAASGRGAVLLRALGKTERPVRLVVVILAGAQMGFSVAAIGVGVAMAVARLVAKSIIVSLVERKASNTIPLSALLGSSGIAIPFALSFALSRPEPLGMSEILTAVCVCVTVSDLITLILWRRKAKLDSDDTDAGTPLEDSIDETLDGTLDSSGQLAPEPA